MPKHYNLRVTYDGTLAFMLPVYATSFEDATYQGRNIMDSFNADRLLKGWYDFSIV